LINDPLKLDQHSEFEGFWWLPDKPDEKVPGILRYEPGSGLSLSLIGGFEDRITSSPSPGVTTIHAGSRSWKIIYGMANRREITLIDCVPIKTNGFFWEIEKQIITANLSLVGVYIGDENDSVFSSVEVSVEDLDVWAGNDIFQITEKEDSENFNITVKRPNVRSVMVGEIEYQLINRGTLTIADQRKGDITTSIAGAVSVKAVPKELFSMDAAKKTANLIQDLISLATHCSSGMLWFRLEVPKPQGLEIKKSGRTVSHYVDVLFEPLVLGSHDARAVDRHRVFFTCDSFPFEQVIPRWCEIYEQLRAPISMILSLRYSSGGYIENNILTAAGAAEVLPRGLKIDKKPFPTGEFKKIRDSLLACAPEEYRARLKSTIRNDPTLRDRLKDLVERLDDDVVAQLVPDVERWSKRTVQARNNLAHQGETPKHEFEELIAIVDVTMAIVLLNILNELGLRSERQIKLVSENPNFSMIGQRAREHFSGDIET